MPFNLWANFLTSNFIKWFLQVSGIEMLLCVPSMPIHTSILVLNLS